MARLFVNLNPLDGRLPGILTVAHSGVLYFGRVIHAEVDHYAPARTRRPPSYEHAHYHIVLVTGGRGFFEIGGKLWPTKPGAIFFSAPGQLHQFLNAGNDTTRYAEVTFEFVTQGGDKLAIDFSELLSEWTKRSCDPVVCRQLTPPLARMIAGRIATLVDRGRAEPRPDDLELGALLTEILTFTYREVFQCEAAPPDQVDRLRDIIRSRYREELHLTALAKEVGLSAAHLSRRFKARFGRAPIDYQLELRLRSACELLRTREDSLAEIASAVGFEDVYYFSRLFRRRLGEAPGAFRRALRLGARDESSAPRRSLGERRGRTTA